MYFTSFINLLLVLHVAIPVKHIKSNSDHNTLETLQVFLLFVYVARNTADVKTSYIHFLMKNFC